jgi:anti-sigma factor RsiW
MEKQKTQVSYAHLHAYTDQELIDQRRVDVADFVKTHPNLIIYVRDYQFINDQLHKLYDGVLHEPIPERLLSMVKNHKAKRGQWKNVMIMIWVGMVLGAVIGIWLHQSQDEGIVTKAKLVFESIISKFLL